MNNPYGNQGGFQPQGFQQQQQGGFQPQNNNQGNQNGFRNSGYDNHSKIQIIGRITKDPESKVVNNSKVASSSIAVNHTSEKTDFWFIEVWGNEGADSKHNYLVNHCNKGRRVFIEGVPELRQTKKQDGYTYYPTIRVTNIVGLDGGSNQQGQGGGQQQQQQPTGQFNGGYQQQPQGQPQGGFPPQQPQGQPQGFAPTPPQPNAPQNGFPPNPPGAFGAPVGVGAPNGGFPGSPNQQ
ncbi:single-stranded DNA-binding protein [Bacillus subtilis]|nr:single-stranded DNA-binding protein [Bacillus subtilis]